MSFCQMHIRQGEELTTESFGIRKQAAVSVCRLIGERTGIEIGIWRLHANRGQSETLPSGMWDEFKH